MGLLMPFSAFTGSWPSTLLADNDPCRDSGENSMDDLRSNTLTYDSDGDTLVMINPTQRFELPDQGVSVTKTSS